MYFLSCSKYPVGLYRLQAENTIVSPVTTRQSMQSIDRGESSVVEEEEDFRNRIEEVMASS
jgi:hypothetical protein